MKVELAGFNVDKKILDSLSGDAKLTPETISAAYARISRDPRSIDQLREEAISDVKKARTSNEQIVFGMGHSSIAEHAVFNFDISGISRLAIEAIEHARLASYTEKSQRYTKLGEEFTIPEEIVKIGEKESFIKLIKEQYETYCKLFEGIRNNLLKSDSSKEEKKIIEGSAKEDARYVTSLAISGQLGMTCNARTLEHMIKKLFQHPLEEVRAVGNMLRDQAIKITPSLLRYLEPNKNNNSVEDIIKKLHTQLKIGLKNSDSCVKLIGYDPCADKRIMTTLLFDVSGLNMSQSEAFWELLNNEQKNLLFKSLFRNFQPWDPMPRFFELVDFQFELIVSASCFAQLKRHRMATILTQPYDISLGYTIPPQIVEMGFEEDFKSIINKSENFYNQLMEKGCFFVAPYALTQSHRRRVIVKMNARELYHFSRLRLDNHAQWDIRNIANEMISLAKEKSPFIMSLACGKDAFDQQKQEVLNK